jgi:ubiquinone/menaquinone biosynthesis C-methylase UbiE
MLSDENIISKLSIKKTEKVLDIGGSMKQHDHIKIDTLVDIIRPEEAPYTSSKLKAKNFVKLDLTRERLPFKDKEFDICLCSHTLEDLYNPFLVIKEMVRVAKRGLIITPSMGQDMVFSHYDLCDWLTGTRRTPGQSHHKWFFLKKGNKMLVIPKNYGVLYSSYFQIVNWKGKSDFEFIWRDKIDYEVITDLNIHKLIDFYVRFVQKNKDKINFGRVLTYWDNPFYMLKEHLKLILKRGEGFKYRNLK